MKILFADFSLIVQHSVKPGFLTSRSSVVTVIKDKRRQTGILLLSTFILVLFKCFNSTNFRDMPDVITNRGVQESCTRNLAQVSCIKNLMKNFQ